MHTLIKYYDYVRNRARRHSATDLSRVSGLHRNNIAAIQNGTNRNPTIGTLKALDAAIDIKDKEAFANLEYVDIAKVTNLGEFNHD